MKKYISYLALIPLVILALTPPWDFALTCKINSLFWLWCVFAAGFLAFLFLYQNVSTWLKLFVIWTYAGCFISRAPYLSFTMVWSVIICAYYYALCKQIVNYTPVKITIQAIFFFITLLIIMQLFGRDTLLNFNMKVPCVLGTIGNPMILGSFVCVCAPFLIFNPLNWIALILIAFISKSAGAFLSILSGLGVYLWKTYSFGKYICIIFLIASIAFAFSLGKFEKPVLTSGRFPVWKRTVELAIKHPEGYGAATYRLLFPIMSQDIQPSKGANNAEWEYDNTRGRGLAWRRTHNDFLQILFETGFPGFILFFGWIISIVVKIRDPIKIAGITILAVNMIPAFPMRMCQSVFIMLMFVAFCEIKENIWPPQN